MKLSILFPISFFLILFTACETDPCEDTDCGTFGNCEEGICVCDEFYEGDNCELEIRERFIGSWTGDLVCDDGTNSTGINFEITPAVEIDVVRIQSMQIYGGKEFLGKLILGTGLEIQRFQVGLNFFSGFAEALDSERIRMTITFEQTGESCVFSLAR